MRWGTRWLIALDALLGVTVVFAALPTTGPPATRSPIPLGVRGNPTPATTWRLVGLGDSITSGDGCPSCAPFVDLYARRITTDTSVPVTVTNLGVGGSTSAELLASLADGQPAADEVRAADIITVTIGANDFFPMLDTARRHECGGTDDLTCFAPTLTALRTNLTSILERVAQLRGDRPTAVRVTGY